MDKIVCNTSFIEVATMQESNDMEEEVLPVAKKNPHRQATIIIKTKAHSTCSFLAYSPRGQCDCKGTHYFCQKRKVFHHLIRLFFCTLRSQDGRGTTVRMKAPKKGTTAPMQNTGITLYNLLLPAALFILKQLGKVQSKARLFFALRHTVFPELENATSAIPPGKFRIWIHASSVGEFEQARPVISTIKASRPDLAVFVSFLSDSGYNARKDYPDADIVFYLPADTPDNAEKTASLLHADLFMLMRYDFWPNHLLAAKRHGATMVLAAAVLRPGSAYFNPLLKGFYRTLFNLFDRIFTVSESNTRAFREQFGCLQAQTAGEPRIDQVILRSKNTERVARLKPLFMNRTVLVAGSVWEKDEETILEAMRTLHNPPSLILVPHKVGTETIERLEKRLQKKNLGFMRVSALMNALMPESRCSS